MKVGSRGLKSYGSVMEGNGNRVPNKVEGQEFPFEKQGLSVFEWNRRLNLDHDQDRLLQHGNPLIRWIEARRRRTLGRLVAAALKGQSSARVLDAGCGTAIVASDLGPPVDRVIYVDIDPAVVSRISDFSRVHRVAADLTHLPLASESLDVAIASAVLEHIPDPDRALDDLTRVLRPGGSLVLCVPYDRAVVALKGALRRLRLTWLTPGLSPGLAPGHLHVFSGRDLRSRLARVGEVCDFSYDPFCFCLFARLVKKEHDD